MSTAWSTYFPGPIVGDNQYTAQVVRIADRKGRSRGFVISGHRGVIWVGSPSSSSSSSGVWSLESGVWIVC